MMPLLFLILLSLTSFAACSSDSPSPAPTSPTPPVTAAPPTPTPAPTGPPIITITASGMTPLEITIAVGQRVTFVNNDQRAHDIVGGIDPAHPECPEILQFLTPGQRSDTGTFMTARTCEYHDHTMLGVPAFQGRIIIR